ncbi:Dual-specificity kinase [Handroanthus impetiginosus]|uniref:Dual-specificity kinase n=1 Tax=Handroanthus impetiginosus TaxID=429701 RepID=A0A2G9G6R7_9LAMI|nr:Dual-specificity kinase [Handroanthus impetiginosus]
MAEEDKERLTRKRRRLTWDVAPSGQLEVDRGDGEDNEARAPPAPTLRRHVSPPKRDDDREGHYVFSLGENLTPRYKILGKMGEGTFGRVLECWDRQTREYVAIKVIRSIKKYRDAAMIEIDVLQRLTKNDNGDSHCVKLHNWFDYRNHICIVFEKLGPSLFDFLKRNKYSPFPVDLVREFGRQLLESVACLRGAEKYFRRSRLNWPEGAVSRESIRAVRKLDQLKNLISSHVDSSSSSLVDLLHGILKFDPSERITARQALDHPFFKDPT